MWRGLAGGLGRATGLVLLACVASCAPSSPEGDSSLGEGEGYDRVFLITVDTLRADHMSLYGYPRATTPRLEEFASDGVVFDRAIAQWPKTGASFASMFTGRYPQTTGLTHRAALEIPEEMPILPEWFQQAGYRTVAVVSNAVLSKELGWGRGFDEYVETWAGNMSDDPLEYRKLLYAGRVNELAEPLLQPSDEKLFAWLHYSDPHAPYVLPEGFENPFLDDEPFRAAEPKQVDLRGTRAKAIGDERDLRAYVAHYDANVLVADTFIGEMLDLLEARGLLDDALVIFTADHGESLGEHELYFEHGPLPYNTTSHVPLFVWAERGVEPRRVAQTVELVDLLPTAVEWVRAEPDADLPELPAIDGVSLTPLIGGSLQQRDESRAFAEAGRRGRIYYRSLQEERWKLVYGPKKEGAAPAAQDFELYDLAADPLESQDLSDREPAQVRRLSTRLLEWMKRAEGAAPVLGDESQQKALDALKALGYVDG